MKIGELTFRQLMAICTENECDNCPLFWPNMQWQGNHKPYSVCVKSLGMYHLMEVIDVEISGYDNK